jgi:hypothetical protein
VRSLIAIAAVATLVAGCGDDGTSGTPDAGRDAGVLGPPDGGPDFGLIDPTPTRACPAQWVVGVSGRIVDERGAGIPTAKAQLCARLSPGGSLVCLTPNGVSSNGDFAIAVPDTARCMTSVTMRLIDFGAPRGTTYCELELTPVNGLIELAQPFVLYDTMPPASLPPIANPTESRVVVLADGVELDVVPEELTAEIYQQIAGARVEMGPACMLAAAPAFRALYAFSPEPALFNGRMGLRLPNTEALAPGATVSLYVIGGLATTLPDGTEVWEGEWEEFGTGTVDGDGAMITSDTPLTTLTWIGYL